MAPARIASIASAAPPLVKMREIADFFADDPAGGEIARIIERSLIETKGMAVNPLAEDPRGWSTSERMNRSLAESEAIGAQAISTALDRAGIGADEIGMLATATTSSWSVPGLASLAVRTGMPHAEWLALGPMACHAGLAGLSTVRNWVEVHNRPAVLLCVDVISTHLQPPPYDMEKAVSLALFGDAAAALVLRPGGPGRAGMDFVDQRTATLPEYADEVSGHLRDNGLEIKTSRAIAALAASSAVRQPVDELLVQNGIRREDVAWWAVHPGGRRIVEGLHDALDLPESSVETALRVMRDYGNVAGATVLMVMERLVEAMPLRPGEPGVAVALGPGATIWTVLLRGA